MKYCCVIGGCGFVGREVVKILVASGRRVRIVGRSSKPACEIPKHVEYLSGDISDNGFSKTVLHNVNEVIDLAYASVPKTSFEDPVQDILHNLPPAVSLLRVASGITLDKYIIVSSGGVVYGDTRSLPITEEHPTNPISPYGITKLAIEKYALMYWRTSSLPVVCVRPGNAYGEGQRPFAGQGFIATAIASILGGKELSLYGDSGTIRDYIHISDLAQGIVAALEHGKKGQCYNLGTGVGRSNRDILESLARLSRPLGFEPIIRVFPHRPFDVPANILDSTKLQRDTGWSPSVSYDEGLERAWWWYAGQAGHGKS